MSFFTLTYFCSNRPNLDFEIVKTVNGEKQRKWNKRLLGKTAPKFLLSFFVLYLRISFVLIILELRCFRRLLIKQMVRVYFLPPFRWLVC